jgi:hypothetical protein
MATPVDYQAYLRSPAWRSLRAKVIVRARGICERCYRWPVVNIHHLTYRRLGSERPEDLLGVCTKCHDEIHRGEGH